MAPSSSSQSSYEAFVAANTNTIGTVESSIRSLTWFLPWFRFREADLASESLTALLNLTSLYHDILLNQKLAQNKPKSMSQVLTSDHARYTAAWSATSSAYKYAARSLEIIKYLQLVFEMLLRRRGSNRTTRRGIVTLEVVKLLLRLTLLRVTGRPLVTPHLPEREVDLATLAELQTSQKPETSTQRPPLQTPDHIKNNHSLFPPLKGSAPNPLLTSTTSKASSVDDFLLSKALTPSSILNPTRLLSPLANPKEWLAEVIYVVRPLLYIITLSRLRRGRKTDVRPLGLSIALEVLVLLLRREPSSNLPLERAEYSRRDRDLFWYLLRGSLWHTYTKPKVIGFVDATERVPIIGMVSLLAKDWLPLIDRYHYYTSS